jgi:hypothetical protein
MVIGDSMNFPYFSAVDGHSDFLNSTTVMVGIERVI